MQPLPPFGMILRALYALITPFPNFLGLFRKPARLLYDFVMFFIYIGVIIQILGIPLFILKGILELIGYPCHSQIWFLAVIATTFTLLDMLFFITPFLVSVWSRWSSDFKKKTRIYCFVYEFICGMCVINNISISKILLRRILYNEGFICINGCF